jgi:hypothetical protein
MKNIEQLLKNMKIRHKHFFVINWQESYILEVLKSNGFLFERAFQLFWKIAFSFLLIIALIKLSHLSK